MEEPLSIFTMQGFYNIIYNSAHNIIGWDPNERNNNVDTGTVVMADSSDVGTVVWSMSEGGGGGGGGG